MAQYKPTFSVSESRNGDLSINNLKETRFGPTIRVLPLLKRYDYKIIIKL